MEFNSINELMDELDFVVERLVNQDMEEVSATTLGLDQRAGYNLFVNEDWIACPKRDSRSLNYYGGFEYVDKDCVKEIGDWVFYSAEDSRVRDHIENWTESKA